MPIFTFHVDPHWSPYSLLLKYQQVPQQLRITVTTSGLRDLPPLVPLTYGAFIHAHSIIIALFHVIYVFSAKYHYQKSRTIIHEEQAHA